MLHSFTRNHNDLSTDAGFQFEFFCDCCGNGYKSTFIESATYGKGKRAEKLGRGMGAISGMLGGSLGSLTRAAERGADVVRSNLDGQSPQWRQEYEEAFDQAQAEIKGRFRKCPSCNKWVCMDCWNDEEMLCIDCAPRESAYVAKARNEAMRRNIDNAAENTVVWHGKLETRTTVCPNCGSPAGSGKFCNNCGAPLAANNCPNCGAPLAPGSKFCGECGTPVNASNNCPNCGAEMPPGTKFCSECGTKL